MLTDQSTIESRKKVTLFLEQTSIFIPRGVSQCRLEPSPRAEVLALAPTAELRRPLLCGTAAFAAGAPTPAAATATATTAIFKFYCQHEVSVGISRSTPTLMINFSNGTI